MKALKELVKVLSQRKLQQAEIINLSSSRKNRYAEFYHALLDGKIDTDKDATRLLYGVEEPNYVTYLMFKRRFQHRLINTIFLTEDKFFRKKAVVDAYLFNQRTWNVAKILFAQQHREAAIALSHQVIRRALKYEFIDIAVESSAILRRHYATVDRSHTKYKHYKKINIIYSKIRDDEALAETLYENLIFRFNKVYRKAKFLAEVEEAILQLEQLQPMTEVGRLQFLYFLILVVKHTAWNDFRSVLEVCDTAISFLSKKNNPQKNTLSIFWNHKIQGCIQLRRFEEGAASLDVAQSLLAEGSLNWFVHLELRLKLAIHSQRYDVALLTYHHGISHPAFVGSLANRLRATWQLYEAYLFFLVTIKAIKTPKSELPPSLQKFKMNKFVKAVWQATTDKLGGNIAVLIIQVVLLILQKDYDKLIDTMDAISKYNVRYLKQNEQLRVKFFIKMLLQIPAVDFHRAAVIRKTATFLKKMQGIPIDLSENSTDNEIVPYEELWAFILEMLENKHRSSPQKKSKTT